MEAEIQLPYRRKRSEYSRPGKDGGYDVPCKPSGRGTCDATADARADDVMHTLDRAATAMLSGTVRKLKQILSRHVNVSTQVIAG